MKATGIVRRIEECVILGQKSKNRINTRDFASLPHPTHWCRNEVLAVFIHSKSGVGKPLRFCYETICVIIIKNFATFFKITTLYK